MQRFGEMESLLYIMRRPGAESAAVTAFLFFFFLNCSSIVHLMSTSWMPLSNGLFPNIRMKLDLS
jgi:hypothetical protein